MRLTDDEVLAKNVKSFKRKRVGTILLWLLFFLITMTIASGRGRRYYAFIIFCLLIVVILAIISTYNTIVMHFFTTKSFINIRKKITKNTEDCNELNKHIETLKRTNSSYGHTDYGSAAYTDNSRWNFKRPFLKNDYNNEKTYQCSLVVCRNASQQPFKYVMKYFNMSANEETLEMHEEMLNKFTAAEQGKDILRKERDEIISKVSNTIPKYILKFNKELLYEQLGFDKFDFSQMYFPKYSFQYVSGGGNSSMRCDVVFDINNLNDFVEYLASIIKFRKSVAGQRALMTTALREHIKERDHYTCKNCKNSLIKEPNLLLEIDHIVPLSKGGMTEEKNLQTLCWRCNRSKGSKIQ